MRYRFSARRALFAAASTLLLAGGVFGSGMFSAAAALATPGFSDISGSEWYAPAALALEAEGVMSPRPDGSFGPYDPVTRGEMAVFLDRILKLQGASEVPFEDLGSYDWYTGAVADLYAAGLVSGTTATTFSPEAFVNRQQAASFITRSLEYFLGRQASSLDVAVPEEEVDTWLGGFRDRLLIATPHRGAVAGACRLGIVQGDTDGWLYPALPVSRAQIAAMMYRAFVQPVDQKSAPPTLVPASLAYPTQSLGSQGTLVYLLETRLAALHYSCGTVDNAYDECTRDAVMAFEKVEKLSRDGVADAAVWERIFGAQVPLPRYSASGRRVEVDLSRQVLFLITDDVVTEIVHVSTGKYGTPTGHGKVWLRQQGWQECSVGWMYYPCYFLPKIAIHGSSSVPPYPASHGCVRTPNWIAVHMYEELFMGIGVDVYY
jgi:hypothetical protein